MCKMFCSKLSALILLVLFQVSSNSIWKSSKNNLKFIFIQFCVKLIILFVAGAPFSKLKKSEKEPVVNIENDSALQSKLETVNNIIQYKQEAEDELFTLTKDDKLKIVQDLVDEYKKKAKEAKKRIKLLDKERSKAKTATEKINALDKMYDEYNALYGDATAKTSIVDSILAKRAEEIERSRRAIIEMKRKQGIHYDSDTF